MAHRHFTGPVARGLVAAVLCSIAAAAFTTLAGAAAAQGIAANAWMEFPSTKSRAEVLAELKQARQDGSMKVLAEGYIESVPSTKTREQVMAELIAARARGEVY